MCIECNKTVLKEIKEDLNIWKDISCSWVGRLSVVRMSVLPIEVNRFNVLPIKILMAFSLTEKQNFKIIWNGKGIQIAKTNLNWKNKVRRYTHTDFKTYYKAPVIKNCVIPA